MVQIGDDNGVYTILHLGAGYQIQVPGDMDMVERILFGRDRM